MTAELSVEQRAAKVKLVIFDVDGVLTDGSLHFGADGETMKTFYVHDGLGIKLLQQAGIETAIISARQSAIVTRRALDLGIGHVYQGGHDKRGALADLRTKLGVSEQECAFIGDDVVDLPILRRVGLAVSVPDGRPEARALAHYVTQAPGGRGAVRELCELVLRAHGQFDAVMAQFFTDD